LSGLDLELPNTKHTYNTLYTHTLPSVVFRGSVFLERKRDGFLLQKNTPKKRFFCKTKKRVIIAKNKKHKSKKRFSCKTKKRVRISKQKTQVGLISYRVEWCRPFPKKRAGERRNSTNVSEKESWTKGNE
jgi:hypothetical protein